MQYMADCNDGERHLSRALRFLARDLRLGLSSTPVGRDTTLVVSVQHPSAHATVRVHL